jgi:hypothetical protein
MNSRKSNAACGNGGRFYYRANFQAGGEWFTFFMG